MFSVFRNFFLFAAFFRVAFIYFYVRFVWIVANAPTFDSIISIVVLLSTGKKSLVFRLFCLLFAVCVVVFVMLTMANMNSCCNCRLRYRQAYKKRRTHSSRQQSRFKKPEMFEINCMRMLFWALNNFFFLFSIRVFHSFISVYFVLCSLFT